LSHKYFIIRLKPGEQFQTHRGVLKHDDLIGKPWGSKVLSHIGNPFFLLQPALGDIIRETRRSTQILYPKDIGFILITMGIGPGQHILEAGTGSGAMTTALAYAVGPTGHVTTYEVRPDMQRLAIRNLTILGLDDRITFKLADIGDGFTEQQIDAAFMDVPNPEDYIHLVRQAVKMGGFLVVSFQLQIRSLDYFPRCANRVFRSWKYAKLFCGITNRCPSDCAQPIAW
jgi:tRNA (adenine57-N1/adenine58-N1)-methyltransferase